MGTRITWLFAIAAWGMFAAPCMAQYHAIDSDDPSPLHPAYQFVDTLYQPSTWHRIWPGVRSRGVSDPQGVYWRAVNTNDTTNDTYAGPIPLKFTFDYYGVNYDSVYLSSNGYIGFGNYLRAQGVDGPGFYRSATGCLPTANAPKAIAAFLMSDGEMVRTKFDSSRAFYRTTSLNDSFFITFYNYYHVSGASTANTIHKFRADVQIVLVKYDSSITFHYRRFTGTTSIGLESYTSEQVFRQGCIPSPCSNFAGVIGVQDASRSQGLSYMCDGAITTSHPAGDLHAGLAVNFRPYSDICRVDSILSPPRNFELLIGDSITPIAVFRNVSSSPQSFYCVFRIRNARTGQTVDSSTDSVVNLAAGATQRITFTKWKTYPQFDEQVGRMIVEAIARPFVYGNQPIGDSWPADDTLRQMLFVIKRLDNFTDFNNNFSTPKLEPTSIPNTLQWVNIGATVVDGDANSLLPPPPRGKQGDPSQKQIYSPVIKLDRRDVNGVEYNRCASTQGGAIGDGGLGDTITSYPVNVSGITYAVVGFSYERAGNHSYPRWYDLSSAIGPERTVRDADGAVLRAGDSLVVEFADTSQLANVTKWKEMWANDGGKDYSFTRVYLPVVKPYTTQNFRFRVRLKAKNDFEAGTPSDDYDDWFVDNVVLVSPIHPEVEVSTVRLANEWPYARVPASQATRIPIEVTLANNGGPVQASFGVGVTIKDPSDPTGDVYAKLLVIPTLSGRQSIVVDAPVWNARRSGPGTYQISAYLMPKGYDSESQNDSTYSIVNIQFDSSFVYDDGINAVPLFYGYPMGLKFPEWAPGNPLGGSQTGTGTGTIAAKFNLSQRDTLRGAMLWFGSWNGAPDAIRISLYHSQGVGPGDTIATFQTVRSAPFDEFTRYEFPGGPIVLDTGEYWIGVSQMGETGMELGASVSRSSCDWSVYDASPNEQHKFIVNYPELRDKFAFENTVGSNSWYPFYFPAGDVGVAGYSNYTSNSAYGKQSLTCGVTQKYFHAQGSWIPMIRPYFGVKTYGPRRYETLASGDVGEIIPQSTSVLFHEHVQPCPGDTGALWSSLLIVSTYSQTIVAVNLTITGPDSSDFSIAGGNLIYVSPGQHTFIINCVRGGDRIRRATLLMDIDGVATGSVGLETALDTAGLVIPTRLCDLGNVRLGEHICGYVKYYALGGSTETITNFTWGRHDRGIDILPPVRSTVTRAAADSFEVCFAPKDTGTVEEIAVITSDPCQRVDTVTIRATGVVSSAVQESRTAVRDPLLVQNRPNPFSDETQIEFELRAAGHARLVVSDMLGREVAVLVDQTLGAGRRRYAFNARALPAGRYVCSLITPIGTARVGMEVVR